VRTLCSGRSGSGGDARENVRRWRRPPRSVGPTSRWDPSGEPSDGFHLLRLAQLIFCTPQGLFGLRPSAPLLDVRQFALHRRCESGQVTFHEVVTGAGFHGGDGEILTHAARDDDERKIQGTLTNDVESFWGAELWKIVTEMTRSHSPSASTLASACGVSTRCPVTS